MGGAEVAQERLHRPGEEAGLAGRGSGRARGGGSAYCSRPAWPCSCR
jgi:hypothetical protein